MGLAWDRIYNEDCLTGMRKMPSEVVDLAFADPPFNIGYAYDVYQDRQSDQEYLRWCRQWLAEIVRVLKPQGTFWLAIGDEYAAELKLIMQRELGLWCRNWVVWYYTFGMHCVRKFSRSHAHLFYMVKDKERFVFNEDAIRVPSARQLVYADRRACPKGRVPDDTWILRPQDLPEGFRPEEDTWYFPRVCGTFKERVGGHGCQMPEQLLGRIIRACSNPGDLVLDPFAGTGTTLAVAKKLHRHFIGFELSAQYTERIEARLAAIQPGDPLAGEPDPLRSVPSTLEVLGLANRAADAALPRRKAKSTGCSTNLPLRDAEQSDRENP
jgi:site-specific DNA-methyltransferase (adenine-specific)